MFSNIKINSLKNKIYSPAFLVIAIAFLVFFIRLSLCSHLKMEAINKGYDFYGYIELAKNIFNRLDFTVNWELDSPLKYPPLFSILIYLLSYFLKNFVSSIQFLEVFGASFCIIPLFLLMRSISNTFLSLLAVIFTIFYFGIRPCVELHSDCFLCFLIITICWLVWGAMINRKAGAARYFCISVRIRLRPTAQPFFCNSFEIFRAPKNGVCVNSKSIATISR